MKRILLIGTLVLVALSASSQDAKTKKVGTLKTNLAKVRAKKDQVRKDLAKTKKAVRVVKGDLREVDQRLVSLEDRLEKTGTSLAANRKLQADLAVELKNTEKQLEAKRVQARTRIRQMYLNGDASVASALVGVHTIGDVASRKYLLESIAIRDRQLFEEVESLCDRVTRAKQRQDQTVRKIGGLLVEQKQQQSELKETREDKAYLLGKLQTKQAELERMAREFDREEDEIQARINAYMRGPGRNSGLTRPSGRLLMPVNGRFGSDFGMRFHPILKRVRMHKGIDIGAPSGTPIKAAADGIVISASYMRGFGNCLIIDHGGGISTLYGHCSRLVASSGQHVKRGQVVAAVGSTGLSTGPHLHFEVHVNGAAVNPRSWL